MIFLLLWYEKKERKKNTQIPKIQTIGLVDTDCPTRCEEPFPQQWGWHQYGWHVGWKEPDGFELLPSPAVACWCREANTNHTGSDGYYRRLPVGLLGQKQASEANYLEETTSPAGWEHQGQLSSTSHLLDGEMQDLIGQMTCSKSRSSPWHRQI